MTNVEAYRKALEDAWKILSEHECANVDDRVRAGWEGCIRYVGSVLGALELK